MKIVKLSHIDIECARKQFVPSDVPDVESNSLAMLYALRSRLRGAVTGHIYSECNCEDPHCFLCKGGMKMCWVCFGVGIPLTSGSSLTSDCCGRQITEDEEHRIAHEESLDFRNGHWVDEPNYRRPKSQL